VRLVLSAIVVVLLVAVAAGCGGGSGDQTLSVGNGQTITVPSDVDGFYGELEAILAQFPYQHWYTDCVVRASKHLLSPGEAEALSELPEAEREAKVTQVTATAGPACEKAIGRPVVDPNSSPKQLGILRAGTIPAMTQLAEAKGLTSVQVACVQNGFETMSDKNLIELRNGTDKVREGILLSVFKPCAKVK
jgi:hypothetical protein